MCLKKAWCPICGKGAWVLVSRLFEWIIVHDQQFRKANAIRNLLDWQPGIAHPDGPKPKGMHLKTFNKLKVEHDFRVQRILGHKMEWSAKEMMKL